MKKTLSLVFLLTLISSQCYASPAVLSPVSASSPVEGRIGIVAAVRGSVKIETPAKVGREVKSGMPVYLGDRVSTDEKGNLQIMLLDQTVFTIGPSSSLIIDKFIYDPSTQNGQVNAKIVKGVFRFVTGKIGQKNPDSMKVDLPAGTIGIRGTIVAGQAQGQRSTVILLGPGDRNNTSSRKGSITVGNTVNGQLKTVLINRSGFGTVIEGGAGAPSSPFKVPAEMMQTITSALGSTSDASNQDSQDSQDGSSNNNQGGEESPTQQAGQDTAQAQVSVESANLNTQVFGDVDQVSTQAAQESVEDQNDIFDGITTFDDLLRIQSGQFKYEQNSVPLYNGTQIGSYNILLTIDFGARTVGGPNSTINGSVNSHAFAFAIHSQTFGSGDNIAYYNFNDNNTTPNNSNIHLDADVVFLNRGGDPASSMVHVVEVQDNTTVSLPTGTGAGIADRQPA